MRKVPDLPSMRHYVGKAARPVFTAPKRPTFRTAIDWRAVAFSAVLAVAGAGCAFCVASALLLGAH